MSAAGEFRAATAAGPRPPRVGGRDVGEATVLAVLAAALYAATAQTRMHGDAGWMLMALVDGTDAALLHPLLAPAHALLQALVGGDPARTAWLLGHVSGGVAIGASFLLARGLGAARAGARTGAALLALSPAAWFFGTAVEVHALHFALAAVGACAVWFAPWRRPVAASAVVLAVVPFVYASHQFSVLLGLGWPALIRAARERDGRPLGLLRALLGYGALVLVACALAQAAMTWRRTGSFGLELGEESSMVAQYFDPRRAPEMLWWGWAACLALLIPAGLLGARRSVGSSAGRWVPLFFCAPPLAFLLFVYAVPERGGFLLGSAPFWAVWAARWRPRPVAAVLLVLAQAALGYASLRSFDRGYDPAERSARVRSIVGEEGLLFVCDHLAPPVHFALPGVLEVDAVDFQHRLARHRGVEPEPALLEELLRGHLGERAVALDLARWRYPDRRSFVLDDPTAYLHERADELEAWITARCVTERFDHPSWPLLVVRGWRSD